MVLQNRISFNLLVIIMHLTIPKKLIKVKRKILMILFVSIKFISDKVKLTEQNNFIF